MTFSVQIKVTHQAKGVSHVTPSSLTCSLTAEHLSHLAINLSLILCNERHYQILNLIDIIRNGFNIFAGEFKFKSHSKSSIHIYFRSKANHWKSIVGERDSFHGQFCICHFFLKEIIEQVFKDIVLFIVIVRIFGKY